MENTQIQRFIDHPDTTEIVIGGEKKKWFLGRQSFVLAKAQGVEIDEILGGGEKITDNFEQAAKLIWAGLLVFDPEVKLEDATMFLSFNEIQALEGAMNKAFEGLGDKNAKGGKTKA